MTKENKNTTGIRPNMQRTLRTTSAYALPRNTQYGNHKKKANIFTDYPFGELAFILLTPEQQLDQKIDHSLDHEV
jgi:hypothetical protein